MEKEYTVDDDQLTNPPNESDFMEDGPVQEAVLNFDKFYNEELVKRFREQFPDSEVENSVKWKINLLKKSSWILV